MAVGAWCSHGFKEVKNGYNMFFCMSSDCVLFRFEQRDNNRFIILCEIITYCKIHIMMINCGNCEKSTIRLTMLAEDRKVFNVPSAMLWYVIL